MKSCLIIEDSKVVRSVIRRIVERMGFTCIEAESGEEAFKICSDNMPDVAIVDQRLPGVTGTQFVEKLRQSKPPRLPVIIFCSADNDVKNMQHALDIGADEYIMKPFDNDIIRSKFTLLNLLPAGAKS